MSLEKETLRKEIYLKNSLLVEGLSFEPDIFENEGVSEKYIENVNAMFAHDRYAHKQIEFPSCFYMPKGAYRVQLRWIPESPYVLTKEDGIFVIRRSGKPVLEDVQFAKRPAYYGKKTSDGADMRTIAQDYGYGNIFIVYSNECCLKSEGNDCKFCNINATKDIYGDAQSISWKSARQIGETVKECYDNGYDKLTVSGGFVPERREVDYYVDIAEAIQDYTGLSDFNGTACVGAPNDLEAIARYKEAGFSTVATNLEIWNEKMFEVICPGKAQFCGGRDNWLRTLKREVEVFGRFRVRSTFVSGIEPKESLLDGFERLVSEGVIALPSQWNVNVGSELEGHRTPEADWHWDVFERTLAIYRKNGLTWELLRNATAEPDTVIHDLLRLEEGVDIRD
ncbi:MAG: radical SAM protein [Clostridiales bacterium]|nr:radical SAM protein [Clostridiales bacterium]